MSRPNAASPLNLVSDIADAAARGATPTAVTRAVAACLARHIPLKAVELAWLTRDAEAADVVHARVGEHGTALASERRPLSASAGRISIERDELILARAAADGADGGPAERAIAEHVGAGWFLVFPMPAEGGAGGFGVLYLAAEGRGRPVLDEDLIRAVGRIIASAQARVRVIGRVSVACRRASRRVGAAIGWNRHAAPPRALVAESPAMRRLVARVDELASSPAPLLIAGPSGAGRGVVARAIHAASGLPGAFVPVRGGARDVAAVLFGRGFPRRRGLAELADRGTLYVSDVDQLPRDVQGALVELVETGRCWRVGGAAYGVDARLLVSSRYDLRALAAANRFEPELAALLDKAPLRVPPLAERAPDIGSLAQAILADVATRHGVPTPRPTTELLSRLVAASWSGEARGLTNALERAILNAPVGTHVLSADDVFPPPQIIEVPVEVEVPVRVEVPVEVPVEVRVEVPVEVRVEVPVPVEVRVEVPVPVEVRVEVPVPAVAPPSQPTLFPIDAPPLPERLDDAMRACIAQALTAASGRVYGPGGAAERLGLAPSTLQSKMIKLGMSKDAFT